MITRMGWWMDTSFSQLFFRKTKVCYILMAISLFLCQLEIKQRYLAGKMNGPDEKGDSHHEEVTMETLGKKC